jgi:ABC-2 type transport system permease protein
MNIYFRELKANLKSLITWSVIIFLLVMVAVSKFASFEGSPELLALLDSMPKAMIDAFSMRSFNLTTISGFLGVMSIYFYLMGAMAGALWGSDIISKEERDKTVEFSLVLPVSRSKVVTAKALAALTYCITFMLITWGTTLVATRTYQPGQDFYDYLKLSMLALFLVELVFLSIGLFLGCALKRYKRSGQIAIAVILVTYFLSIAIELQDKLDFLKYVTPFKYFDPATLYTTGKLEGIYLVLSALIIVICVVGGYWIYNKRDLYI